MELTLTRYDVPAMVNNATLERRPIYHHVARLNREVLNIGQALRFLTSTDVRYVPGPGNKVPAGAELGAREAPFSAASRAGFLVVQAALQRAASAIRLRRRFLDKASPFRGA